MTEEKKQSGYQLTTLGDLGPSLPMGLEVSGKLYKNFKFRPWRFKEEKYLGKIREDNKGMSVGEFVIRMMSYMLVELGPHNFSDSMSEVEKNLIVSQCFLGDVLYMYAYLRKEALGEILDTQLGCPFCDTNNRRKLNMNDLDVRIIDSIEVLTKLIQLKDGLAIFGDLRSELKVKPPRWQIMESPEMVQTDNDAIRLALMIKECVCGADGIDEGKPIAILDNDLDEMSKYDLAKTQAEIEDTPGPQMAVELKCSKCKRNSFQVINWQYDSFFSTLSTSQSIAS